MTHEEANSLKVGRIIYEPLGNGVYIPWYVYKTFVSKINEKAYRIGIRRLRSYRRITKQNHNKYEDNTGVEL